MFAEVNNLPADDPLHAANAPAPQQQSALPAPAPTPSRSENALKLLPAKVLAAFKANGGTSSMMPDAAGGQTVALHAPVVKPAVQNLERGAVIVDSSKRVAVPSFDGNGLRTVVEQASAIGLRVEPVGSGLAREQVPAAGTMVPVGTQVVVRFTR